MHMICVCQKIFDRGKLFYVSSAPLTISNFNSEVFFFFLTSELQTASVFSSQFSPLPTVPCYLSIILPCLRPTVNISSL